jgi:hypothetical protein
MFAGDIFYFSQDGTLYKLPKAGVTDLASIPRPLWSLLPPQGEDGEEYGLAACGHDFAYKNLLMKWDEAQNAWVKAVLLKPDCDLLLKEMMIACKVPADIVETIYEGVRLGGQYAFNGDRA